MAARTKRFGPRRSKSEIPTGWTHAERPSHLAKNDTHSYYRCGSTAYVPCSGGGLELRRCTHVCRKQYISIHVQKGDHVYSISQSNDPGFPQYVLMREETKLQSRLRSLIMEKLARLVLETGISINRTTKEGMKNFIIEMIRLGMAFSAKSVNIEEAIGDFSRRVLTDQILHLGTAMKKRDMDNAREIHFVNIIVDAGTVLGRKVIHSMLTNPYSDNFPIILEVSDNTGFDKAKYKEFFQLLLYQCQMQGLTVCSVITDGLKAQKLAILELLRESEEPKVQAVHYLHCLAHLTQLVFTDTVKQCAYLRQVVHDVREFTIFLRKQAAITELGEKCPLICPTRWLYLVDVLSWIFERQEKLEAFLLASENNRSGLQTLPEDWKRMLLVLLPLKRMNLLMESSNCALWEVIPIVERVLFAWKRLIEHLPETDLLTMKIIVSNLFMRLRQASPSVVMTAYSLSELGRARLRQMEHGFQTKGPEQECFISDRISSLNEWVNDMEPEKIISLRNGEGNMHNESVDVADNEGEEFEEPVAAEEEDEAQCDGDEEEYAREDFLSLSIEELLDVSVYNYTHEAVFNEMARVGAILDIPREYVHNCLCEWLYSDRRTTPTGYDVTASPDTIWRRVPVVNNNWRDFAGLALRFVTISTSEADCERSLSRQRDVQGLHTCNISAELLEARLRS